MMDSAENNLAGPETVLGMLRRGRGGGFLAACAATVMELEESRL
jgi:hypothetical protein